MKSHEPAYSARLRPLARFVMVAAGLTLLAAAVLKMHQLATAPSADDSFWPNRPLAVLLVLGESLLSGWLLAGVFPAPARAIATGCFGVFFVVSVQRGIAGEASCGCFGIVSVTPWLTAALDAGMVALLLVCGTPAKTAGRGWATAAALSTLATASAGWLLYVGEPPARVRADPPVVNLGTVLAGGRATGSTNLSYPYGPDLHIPTVRTSCECVSLVRPASHLVAGRTLPVQIVLDLSHDPRFTGGMLAKVEGLTADGQTAFTLSVRVLVVAE